MTTDVEVKEFDIPVLFQVSSTNEDDAADALAFVIGHNIANEKNDTLPRVIDGGGPNPAITIESWHMPNHQSADGSDNPVRVVIVPLEPAYSQRLSLTAEIQRLVGVEEPQSDLPLDERAAIVLMVARMVGVEIAFIPSKDQGGMTRVLVEDIIGKITDEQYATFYDNANPNGWSGSPRGWLLALDRFVEKLREDAHDAGLLEDED